MSKNELEELARLLAGEAADRRTTIDPSVLLPSAGQTGIRGLAGVSTDRRLDIDSSSDQAAETKSTVSAATELGRISYELTRTLQRVEAAPSELNSASSSQRSAPSGGSGDSTAESVVKTIGMVTGVGPLVTGLLKLFGSSEPEAPPSLTQFQMPSPVAVEAGLTGDGQFTALSYAQGGLARPLSQGTTQPGRSLININVQAMDSRSFLDHSSEIARAVREAMLHSHSLNDVVSEL